MNVVTPLPGVTQWERLLLLVATRESTPCIVAGHPADALEKFDTALTSLDLADIQDVLLYIEGTTIQSEFQAVDVDGYWLVAVDIGRDWFSNPKQIAPRAERAVNSIIAALSNICAANRGTFDEIALPPVASRIVTGGHPSRRVANDFNAVPGGPMAALPRVSTGPSSKPRRRVMTPLPPEPK